MLKWIAGKLNNQAVERLSKVVSPSDSQVAGGWFLPLSAEALLNTRSRKQALQQLWDNSPFSRPVWETFWLEPVKQLAVRLQHLPAGQSGKYAHEGGMLDEALDVAVCAVRLSRGWMLPPGAPPEEQSAQGSAWCTAIFWAALLHDLGALEQMAAFHEDGRRWFAGLEVPEAPWRIRFCDLTPNSEVRAAAYAYRLLPYDGLRWISRWPQLTDALLVYLSGNKSAGAILNAAVSEAREKCGLTNQLISHQSSAKSVAENLEPLLPSEIQASGEHPVNQMVSSPVVTTENKDDIFHSFSNAQVSELMPELVSAISQSDLTVEDAESIKINSTSTVGGTPGELLSLLDKMTCVENRDVESSTPSDDKAHEVNHHQPNYSGIPTLGECFWNWLINSVDEGTLSVNAPDSLLHIMAQYIFVQTPDCFYRYLTSHGNNMTDKEEVQKSFEALDRHFSRNGKGIYVYRKYESENREGRFTRISGYMILLPQVFRKTPVFSDSLWLAPNK
jgi:integrating conjugative element relaxase (TIGR03760 family)